MKLSKHFRDKWEDRFGKVPTLKEVIDIIQDSVWVLKCRDMRSAENGIAFRTLGTYVHFKRKVIIKVDEIEKVVVTLLTEGDEKYTQEMERLYGPKIC